MISVDGITSKVFLSGYYIGLNVAGPPGNKKRRLFGPSMYDGQVTTSPQREDLLPGITQGLVTELARVITSTKKLDLLPVGAGDAGPVWRQFNALYADVKRRSREHRGNAR